MPVKGKHLDLHNMKTRRPERRTMGKHRFNAELSPSVSYKASSLELYDSIKVTCR